MADKARVTDVLNRIAQTHGRIDGLIHGAGIIRDAFLEFMTVEDFEQVVQVKLAGAWNLRDLALPHGLRFMAVLSSVAGVQGNAGQVNYCAANRSMSALMKTISGQNDAVVTKALMLPPIEGAGMADNPDMKELLKLRDMMDAYVHVDELAEFFCRELFLGPKAEQWVLLARTLPEVETVQIDLEEQPAPRQKISGGLAFDNQDLPLIDGIHRLDLKEGLLEAGRVFSHKRDLWIDDHKPFKFLKHPLVSGIMALETFIEAAHVLYPHLQAIGVRNVEYKDTLDCPTGVDRTARIICRRLESNQGRVLCRVSMESRDISTTGRLLDRWSTNYEGQVILAGEVPALPDIPDFPIRADELVIKSLNHKKITEWYETKSAMGERYRLLEKIEGAGPEVIVGYMTYNQGVDIADFDDMLYKYPPYLFESLMHLFAIHSRARDPEDQKTMIPYNLRELLFTRRAISGERFLLEARLREEDDETQVWDARGSDESGAPVLQAMGIVMRRFEE